MQRQEGPRGTWRSHARRSATFVHARNLTIRHVRRHPAAYRDRHVDARPAAEPVAFGLVKSRARPGGNLAGLTSGPGFQISWRTSSGLKHARMGRHRVPGRAASFAYTSGTLNHEGS